MKVRSAVFGATVLVVLLTAGAAQSLTGSNTVFSDDIVDHAVTAADLGTNSVTKVKVADNAISSAEIKDGSVTNSDLATHKVYFARVRYYGILDGGDATSASGGGVNTPNSGEYAVDFPFSVAACSVTATTSTWPNPAGQPAFTQPVFIGTDILNRNHNEVTVNVWDKAGNLVDADFVLNLICP